MSSALSGPASALGQGVKLGVDAYFSKVNKSGGVNGHTLSLIALDDGYEPKKAAPNMDTLIDKEKVVAVMGNVGTPTAVVTTPIANAKKTLLFGAFTGAGLLRKTPPDRYIINYRASYAEETSAMIEGLLSAGIKAEEIAFFTQNDGYGDAGYNGALKALKAKGVDGASLAHGRYERNTTNVEDGLGTILDADVEPKAVIMVGAYKPCAAFIKLAKEELPETLFLNVSFVGSIPLLNELGSQAEGVIVTQVVPHYESSLPGVNDYRKDLAAFKADAKPDFVSLEGYLIAKIFVEGVKKATSTSREGIIDGLESLSSIDIGTGVPVTYNKSEHQASHKVWPTVIKGGKYVELDWNSL
ncbi:ligand-binding receptor [Marinomonas agarivorans]|nr:ligand-binding receptor [Marinomonas agarivorans]